MFTAAGVLEMPSLNGDVAATAAILSAVSIASRELQRAVSLLETALRDGAVRSHAAARQRREPSPPRLPQRQVASDPPARPYWEVSLDQAREAAEAHRLYMLAHYAPPNAYSPAPQRAGLQAGPSPPHPTPAPRLVGIETNPGPMAHRADRVIVSVNERTIDKRREALRAAFSRLDLASFDWVSNSASAPAATPPAPRLVGIETNPGPKGGKKAVASAAVHRAPAKKKQQVITGHGNYTLPSRGPGLAQFGGQSWGSAGGEALSHFLPGSKEAWKHGGDLLHKGLKFLTGWGDYTTRSQSLNSAMESSGHVEGTSLDPAVLQGYPAKFRQNNATDATVIVNREYLGPVTSSTAFSTTRIPIQPGTAAFMPWGSGVADRYQQYRLRAAVIEFRATMAPSFTSTSGAVGKVMLSSVYDPTKPNLTSSMSILNTEFSVSGVPYRSFYHLIECNPRTTALKCYNVRSSDASVSNLELDNSDMGFVQVSTEGNPTTGAAIGDLFISYVLELMKPIDPTGPVPNELVFAHYSSTNCTAVAGGTPVFGIGTAGYEWPSTFTPSPLNNYELTVRFSGLYGSSFDTVNLPIGRYRADIVYCYQNNAVTGCTVPSTGLAAYAIQLFAGGTIGISGYLPNLGVAGGDPNVMRDVATVSDCLPTGAYTIGGIVPVSKQYISASIWFVVNKVQTVPNTSYVRFTAQFSAGLAGQSTGSWDVTLQSMPDQPAVTDGARRDPTVAHPDDIKCLREEIESLRQCIQATSMEHEEKHDDASYENVYIGRAPAATPPQPLASR